MKTIGQAIRRNAVSRRPRRVSMRSGSTSRRSTRSSLIGATVRLADSSARFQSAEGAAQGIVDPRLPALASRPEAFYDVGIDSQLNRNLAIGFGRPPGSAAGQPIIEIRGQDLARRPHLRELGVAELRDVVDIVHRCWP